jgi:hypothetical protein
VKATENSVVVGHEKIVQPEKSVNEWHSPRRLKTHDFLVPRSGPKLPSIVIPSYDEEEMFPLVKTSPISERIFVSPIEIAVLTSPAVADKPGCFIARKVKMLQ